MKGPCKIKKNGSENGNNFLLKYFNQFNIADTDRRNIIPLKKRRRSYRKKGQGFQIKYNVRIISIFS